MGGVCEEGEGGEGIAGGVVLARIGGMSGWSRVTGREHNGAVLVQDAPLLGAVWIPGFWSICQGYEVVCWCTSGGVERRVRSSNHVLLADEPPACNRGLGLDRMGSYR